MIQKSAIGLSTCLLIDIIGSIDFVAIDDFPIPVAFFAILRLGLFKVILRYKFLK